MTEVNSDQDKQALTITGVTVADSAALSANNIPAFWADPHWLLTWRHRTLEYHISEVSHRFPITVLLAERQVRRHQKAVDLNTGRVLGYARWHIPYEYATQADGTPTWPEAVVPAVSSEEEVDLQRAHDEVTSRWDPNMEPDVLFGPMREIKNEVIRNKTFMRK